jgi:hypothetical protein
MLWGLIFVNLVSILASNKVAVEVWDQCYMNSFLHLAHFLNRHARLKKNIRGSFWSSNCNVSMESKLSLLSPKKCAKIS